MTSFIDRQRDWLYLLFCHYKIPGLESPTRKHSPLPPPKVIKSILKKNKSSTPPHLSQVAKEGSQMDENSGKKPDGNNEKLHSKLKHSTENWRKLQINNALDSSIDGESLRVERDSFNKHLKNGIASKAHKNLHTVQVDIH